MQSGRQCLFFDDDEYELTKINLEIVQIHNLNIP